MTNRMFVAHAVILGALLCRLAAADTLNVRIIGRLVLPESPCALAAQGGYVYVADDTAGLVVVDVSKPASPYIVAQCSTAAPACGVVVVDAMAFVQVPDSILMMSVSDPNHPARVGSYAQYYWPGFCAKDNWLYVLDTAFMVVDVSNPSDPQVVGTYDTSGMNNTLLAATSGVVTIFVDEDPKPLWLMDVSDPAQPMRAAQWGEQWNYYFDVRDPANPMLISSYVDQVSEPLAVAVAGRYAYVSGRGIDVVDVSDPSDPNLVGYLHENDLHFHYLAAASRYAFIAIDESLFVIENLVYGIEEHASMPRVAGIARLSQNPVRGGVRVLLACLPADIRLYDAQGAVVADARDVRQSEITLCPTSLRSGAYFAVVRNGATTHTLPVVVTR